MFGLKPKQKKRVYSIPESHNVVVFKLMPYPLKNIIYFDMVDIEGMTNKQISRLTDWKRFWIQLRYSSPKYDLEVISSSSSRNFERIRDEYFND